MFGVLMHMLIFIDHEALAKQGDNALGSVRLCPLSRPRSKSNFWHAAVDNRALALPSAAKSNGSHYQSVAYTGNRAHAVECSRSFVVSVLGLDSTYSQVLGMQISSFP